MKPIIVIGGGGHAGVVLDLLQQTGKNEILGFTDMATSSIVSNKLRIPKLGNDEFVINNYSPDSVWLVNGLGSTAKMSLRESIFNFFKMYHYEFMTLVHPRAIVAPNVIIEEGAQIMAGVIIQTGSTIGKNSIVNTGSIVDHDCTIGSHVHIAPGVTLSGNVIVENGVHVGTGASIIQGVNIATQALVGAGSVVIQNVQANITVMGVPAKEKL
jgi:sugar O-acyltransferase (sialic acid O-acetyltransferase NeuD family)